MSEDQTVNTTEQPAATAAPTEVQADAPAAKIVGTRVGQVVSDARQKTRKVVVSYLVRDSKYGKYVRRRSVFHVHDDAEESRAGDTVEIIPCRPISKTKSWRLVRVLEAAADRKHD